MNLSILPSFRADRRKVAVRDKSGNLQKLKGKPCGKSYIAASYKCKSHYTNGKLNAEGRKAQVKVVGQSRNIRGLGPSKKAKPPSNKLIKQPKLAAGSAKQRDWATLIRSNSLDTLPQAIPFKSKEQKKQTIALFHRAAAKMNSADWWISNRRTARLVDFSALEAQVKIQFRGELEKIAKLPADKPKAQPKPKTSLLERMQALDKKLKPKATVPNGTQGKKVSRGTLPSKSSANRAANAPVSSKGKATLYKMKSGRSISIDGLVA